MHRYRNKNRDEKEGKDEIKKSQFKCETLNISLALEYRSRDLQKAVFSIYKIVICATIASYFKLIAARD